MTKRKRARVDIETLRAHAREKGGVCKSDAYFKVMTKYTWVCANGHEWDTTWNSIQQGSWCPDCAGVKRHELSTCQEHARSKGGKCLSTEYTNAQTKLRWRCADGHEWDAVWGNIQQGTWCPECAIQIRADKQRGDISTCQEHAHKMGSECLSTEYKNSHTKLRWRCADGHEWDAKWNVIQQGRWCPCCAIKRNADKRRGDISICQEHAHKMGGECLSTEYVNNNTKLRWRCADGHEWDAKWNDIQQGHWCPDCAIKRNADKQRLDILTCQGYAHKMGGECLSTEYVNNNTKLRWRCADGHEWDAVWGNIQQGSWCPECAIQIRADKLRGDISTCQEHARKLGGECLSTEYINSSTHLRWKCAQGHEWDAVWGNIQQGHWCPKCMYKSEQFTREVLEYLCKPHRFTKARPDWLRNPKTGQNLELDGYCEDLRVAFEYNGIQHYEYHPHFHNDEEEFEYQQWRDAFKKESCAAHGIRLIIIPNQYSVYNRQELFDFIRDTLNDLQIQFDVTKTLDDFIHSVPHQRLITDYFS